MQDNFSKAQSLILENRKNLSLTGVEDVLGFNEEAVSLSTSAGDLIVRGSKLHISRLDLDKGEVEIDGEVNLLQYAQKKSDKTFIQRLLG